MRIVIDARAAHEGLSGIGRYALNLCLSLEKAGEAVSVTALTSPPGRGYLASMTCIPLHVMSSTGPESEEFVLPDVLKALQADVYHTPLFVLPRLKPCRYVCTVHDVIPRIRPDLTSEAFLGFFTLNITRALASADRIVTVSEHSRRDLLASFRIDPARVRTVHEPVSSFFRRPPEPVLGEALRAAGLRPGFLLSVGAIDRRKNLGTLLLAYQMLQRRWPETPPLVVVGQPSGDGYDIQEAVAQLGIERDVLQLGRVPDRTLVALYSAAGVFVFPSLYEGFGLPVIEAMACGTPVATSRCSSLPEVAGDAAVFFDPGDPVEMSHVMEKILRDRGLREDLARRGLERAKLFDPARQGDRLLELYRELTRAAA